ncbi:MAG: hypothetical protein HY881_12250 [Deltaproteobacteria bacterium]|nr:hypothetical protein [Deltaproteobacteria bacterium]
MIGLWLMCSGVLIPQSAWSLDPALREAFIASLPRGETFENDGSTYVWLPTLRAEKTDGRKAESSMNANAGSALTNPKMEDVIERKGLFAVYRRSLAGEASIHAVSGSSGDVQTYPVVLNLETKSLGIITGNLWLKLKDMQDARPIAEAFNMTLSFVNIAMETAFYEFPADVNILTLRKHLEADARISLVTLDMVDRISHPR